jgi:hypothetical protein
MFARVYNVWNKMCTEEIATCFIPNAPFFHPVSLKLFEINKAELENAADLLDCICVSQLFVTYLCQNIRLSLLEMDNIWRSVSGCHTAIQMAVTFLLNS